MRYVGSELNADWVLTELVGKTNEKRPCSDAYADDANDEELKDIFSQLRLLRAAGCPADLEKGRPTYQKVGKHRPAGWKTDLMVHVLKAKPSRWRLYYVVLDQAKRHIAFLYAVSKKTQKRDPKDLSRCGRLLDAYAGGSYALSELEVPDR